MRAVILKDSNRIDEAVSLIIKVFFKGDIEKFILPNKTLVHKNIIIIENDDNLIVGTSIIIDREIYFNRNIVKASLISFVCIDEKYRGFGLSRKLINCFIDESKKRKSVISLVIARKIVDNFYNKFNFNGISQYSKIKTSIDNIHVEQEFDFIHLNEKFHHEINKIYNLTYSKTHGAFLRNSNYWVYVDKKVKALGLKLQAVINKKICGYVIYDKNNIFEIALNDNVNYLDVISQLVYQNKINKNLSIHCSLDHPINFYTKNIDYSITNRQCKYGGHMIRINDLIYLKKNFLKQVEMNNKVIEKFKTEIMKLEFKNLNYENLSLLAFSNILSNSKYSQQSFSKSFNIPLMDQI